MINRKRVGTLSMLDFQKLFAEVIRQQPSISEEVLHRMIQEKKKKVGGGYLTDQGSLFLVAAELGVSLENVAKSHLKLKDAYIGARDISLPCRVFAIYPTKSYTKKRDGSEGKYRRLVVYDREDYLKVTLWDENCDLIEKLGVKVGSPVRLLRGYVKSGIDGRPVLNIGNRGAIELIDDESSKPSGSSEGYETIPEISTKILQISEVSAPAQYLCLIGKIKSPAKTSEFTRRNGTKGTVTNLFLFDISKGISSARLALWDYPKTLELKENQVIQVYNVRSKILPHGEIEYHGDESTEIFVVEDEKPVMIALRLLNKVSKENNCSCVAIDKDGNFYSLYARGSAAIKISKAEVGSVFSCQITNRTDSRIYLQNNSEVEISPSYDEKQKENSFTTVENLKVKLKDLANAPKVVFVEVMSLSNPMVQDVGTKDGLIVRRGEVVVGDETAETRLIGWRGQAEAIGEIHTGEKFLLKAVDVQNRDGRVSLVLRPYSSISKITTN
jgi:hypothetical protein